MHSRSKRMIGTIGLLTGLLFLAGAAFTPSSVMASDSQPQTIKLSPSGYSRANSVTFSSDGSLLAVGSSLGVHFFDAQALQEVRFIATPTLVRSLAFSPDGSLLASGSYDPVVRLWRVNDGGLVRELKGHSAWVRSVSYSPDGTTLATASDDDTVRLWNVSNGNPILVLREGTQGVRAVSFSPDGAILATGGYDHTIRLWRVSDGTLLRELQGHTDWVRALAFSPDGELLASGAFDATVRLWRVADGKLLATREEHSSSVLGLAFSPDGGLLASTSVDTSIRLWQMPELTPYELLTGHSDFVYSVAFSPNVKTLVSGAADNTVRIWDLPVEANPAAQDRISTPSNCKACHHPRSGNLPARVIETNCTICHQDEALVLNWCPALDRTSGGTTRKVSYNIQAFEGGIPQATRDFSVVISTPGNGEHLYTPQDIFTLIPINGYVFSETVPLTEIELQLGVWSGNKQVASISVRPGANGTFSFTANIRPEGGEPFPSLDGHKFYCVDCHKVGAIALPPGEVRLIVTATAADGSQAFDERLIYVDRSRNISIPVSVMLDNDQPIPDVPPQATTRLYEWRGRTFTSLSSVDGLANLHVEALSQVPTRYQILLPPVVVDGVLYESVEPVEVTLPPGATSAPPITLRIRSTKGRISGRLTPPVNAVGVSAIHLPDGAAFRTQSSSQGTFVFPELPIGRYLLVGDQDVLAAQGLVSRSQTVDLSQTSSASVDLSLSPLSGTSLEVAVHQVGGDSIPFANITADKDEITQAVSPDSGRFTLAGLPPKAFTLTVSAPGFYSQAHVIDAIHPKPVNLALVLRPETRGLPWGSGQVTVPAEMQLTEDGLHLTLEQGWLWGSGGDANQPLRISLNGEEVEIGFGSFAIEQIPGEAAWLYIFEGQATLRVKADSRPVVVSKGQMVAFAEGFLPVPVPYDSAVVAALHPARELPLVPTWQPSLEAQIRDRLAQVGIGTAQILTLVTYLMAFLFLLVMPVLAVNRYLKGKQKRKP